MLENSRLDPNDPRNAELLQLIESVPSSSMQPDFFQLASVDEVETFVAHDEFSTDKRFSMLVMRDDGVSICNNYVLVYRHFSSNTYYKQTNPPFVNAKFC